MSARPRTVTVFGGTGFLGRRVVRHLRKHGLSVQIASRHPDRGHRLFGLDPQPSIGCGRDSRRAISRRCTCRRLRGGKCGQSLRRARTADFSFRARRVCPTGSSSSASSRSRTAHVSGIGADAASQSLYVRKRGEGELAVRAAFADALLIRPAVMFGPDDAFLTTILKLLRRLPIYPMFGRGLTRLQPAFVEDVAEAVARALQGTEMHAITYECGGPRVYSYEELLRAVAHEATLKPMLIPIPFVACHALAWFAEMLPSPPVTRNQVELMQVDNVSSPEMSGFGELGISPHSVEEILQEILWDH